MRFAKSRALEEFSLKLTSSGSGYKAIVQQSPAGQGEAPFEPPIIRGEIDSLRKALNYHIPRTGCSPRELDCLVWPAPIQPSYEPSNVGQGLGGGFFAGDVQLLFAQSIQPLRDRPDECLRLSIHFSLTDEEAVWLGALPWELIRTEFNYLLYDKQISLVHCLDLRGPTTPAPILRPLEILVVVANPQNSPTPEANEEYRGLLDLSRDNPSVHVTRLETPTAEALGQAIDQRTVHVLHFIGHASFNEKNEGTLLFENSQGGKDSVTGEVLAAILGLPAKNTLRLVVLNACLTGSFPVSGGNDPWNGVATALLVAGFPAVVAMRYPITGRAAVLFSHGFYSGLAAGASVDAAMIQGRHAILRVERGSLEWATPALFLRGMVKDVFKVRTPRWIPLPGVISAFGFGIFCNLLSRWMQGSPSLKDFAPFTLGILLLPAILFLGRYFMLRIHRMQRQKMRLVAALLALVPLLTGYFLPGAFGSASPSCDGLTISRVEVDLPSGTRDLELDGARITDLTGVDLQGLQHLTGRAVFTEPTEGCPCEWLFSANVGGSVGNIGSSRDCAFTIDLPAQYSQVFLQLKSGQETSLFTLQFQE